MSLTQRHVQKVLINEVIESTFSQMQLRQAVQHLHDSGRSMMPLQYSNGQYDQAGSWQDFLLCDITPINKGVLK